MSTKTSTTVIFDDSTVRSAATGHGFIHAPQYVNLVRSRTGSVNPKFAQLIKDGKDATNAFTAYDRTVTQKPGSARITWSDNSGSYTDTYMGISHLRNVANFVIPTGSFPSNVSNEAVAKATSKVYEDIRERQMPFQAQVFSGELTQTLALLKDPTKGLANLTNALALKHNAVGKSSAALADLWLEYRFGVLPLINDINAIIDVFDDLASRGSSEVFRKKGFSASSSVVTADHAVTSGVMYRVNKATIQESSCYISGGYLASTEQRLVGLKAISADLQNIANLPITAWELVPWSFLVDYFVNIGDIILAGTTSKTSLRYASVSTVNVTKHRYSTAYVSLTSTSHVKSITNVRPKEVEVTLREVSRSAGLMAIPPLVFTLPGSKIRYANIAALLTSSILSK